MNQDWPTKYQDMSDAQEILSFFGADEKILGIFEIGMDLMGNINKVTLSDWVITLTKHFRSRYGDEQGDNIVKKILSINIVKGETIH